jgi:hypothetical protein
MTPERRFVVKQRKAADQRAEEAIREAETVCSPATVSTLRGA